MIFFAVFLISGFVSIEKKEKKTELSNNKVLH